MPGLFDGFDSFMEIEFGRIKTTENFFCFFVFVCFDFQPLLLGLFHGWVVSGKGQEPKYQEEGDYTSLHCHHQDDS